MRDGSKHDYLPIIVYVDNVLERYLDLRNEMSNKAKQPSININSMDLDSANNHPNKINADTKVILKTFIHLMNLLIDKHCICVTTWLCTKCSCCLHEYLVIRIRNCIYQL